MVNFVWLVGIYAPNQATQYIALWSSLLRLHLWVIRVLLMDDYNMCVCISIYITTCNPGWSWANYFGFISYQGSSIGCMDVVAWEWSRFTFQCAQHRKTWSWLNRMYVMYEDSFLSVPFLSIVLQYVRFLDHCPIFLEVCNYAIDMHKSLLKKPQLWFNSCLLFNLTLIVTGQILVNFHQWIIKQ